MRKPSEYAISAAHHLTEWLNRHVPSIMAASPHSRRNYKTSIALYMSFLVSYKKITPSTFSTGCFSTEYISQWIVWMKETRGCSAATCNVRLSALRSYLEYLSHHDISFMERYMECCTIPSQKTEKRKVSGVSKRGVKALLSVPKIREGKGMRDFTMILTLYSCALRVSELVNLRIRDICVECAKPHLTVVGKGRKIRTLPLLSKPTQCMERFIKSHPGADDPDAFLFYSKSKGIKTPMTQRNVDKMLKSYAFEANKTEPDVPVTLHAHQLRHAKASHWLENGMNIAQISHLLGHESIQTTMVYLDISTQQESVALATLEDENQKKTVKKWKSPENESLIKFMGLD